jgi:hypothetical protein
MAGVRPCAGRHRRRPLQIDRIERVPRWVLTLLATLVWAAATAWYLFGR